MLKTLDQALKILNLFASEKKLWTVKEISEKLNIPSINVYRIMETFASNQYLIKNEKTKQYELGAPLAILGHLSIKKFNVYDLVHPYLENLSSKNDESVYLIKKINGFYGTNIDSVLPENRVSISLSLNKKINLYSGAGYWSILAYLNQNDIENNLNGKFDNLLKKTSLNPSVLKKNLDFIRKNGWGFSSEITTPDVFSISSPIFSNKKIVGAVDMAIPTFRIKKDNISKLGEQIKNCAQLISRELTAKNTNLDFYTFFKDQYR